MQAVSLQIGVDDCIGDETRQTPVILRPQPGVGGFAGQWE